MKSLAKAFKLAHCLVSWDVNHSKASPLKLRIKSRISSVSSLPTPTSWSEEALRCAKGFRVFPKVSNFGILNTSGRSRFGCDDVRNALKFLHCFLKILFYVYLCSLFFWLSLSLLLLIMVEFRTIHIMLIWNGNLKGGFSG